MEHTKLEIISKNNKAYGVRNKSGFICFMREVFHFPDQDERYKKELEEVEEFARLIAEAGNVANESGFTPRQLLEQRNFLLEACESLLEYHKAKQAIAIAKGE